MTPEKRMDQLEPVIADMIRKQDEIYQQNRLLATMLFDLSVGLSQLKMRVTALEADMAQLKADVAELKTNGASMDAKLDMILTILRSGNGH